MAVFQIKLMCAKYCAGSSDDCKMYQGRVRLDIRKILFSEGEVKHWIGLPRAVVKSLMLEMFKKCTDVPLRNKI